MNKLINSVLVVGSLALLGGACYKAADTNVNVVGNTNVVESNTNVLVNTNTVLNTNVEVNTNSVSNINSINGLEAYTNEKYGFNFQYPNDWTVEKLSDEELYLENSIGDRIKFYTQSYEGAPEQDTLLYSKETLTRLKDSIAENDRSRIIDSLIVDSYFAYDPQGDGFFRAAEFFVNQDFVRVIINIFPTTTERPYGDAIDQWSEDIVNELNKGNLLTSKDQNLVQMFDQIINSLQTN